MKIIRFCVVTMLLAFSGTVRATVEVRALSRAKVPLVCVADTSDSLVSSIVDRLKQALGFSNQFDVVVRTASGSISKKYLKELYAQGYCLALIVSRVSNDRLEWRLYDTLKPKMVAGKTADRQGNEIDWWALHIANNVWPELTGTPAFFTTKIAYSKQVSCRSGTHYKHICVADFDGRHEQVLVQTPTINIVPRWNSDSSNPLLFYSEYTNANVRMMVVDTHKRRRIASNFEGINMLTTFSGDGKKVVYCASRGDGNCQMYYHTDGVFKRLLYTDPRSGKSLSDGNNVSPSLSLQGDMVYFCSDFQTHLPQIYCYDIASSQVTRITDGGYCASPNYCHATGKLAYTKKVDGVMQLCTYDTKTHAHTQLTFDVASKDECSWSPCGNYILFAAEADDRSRVFVYSMLTKDVLPITPPHIDCSYPSWSPLYPTFTIAENAKQAVRGRVAS